MIDRYLEESDMFVLEKDGKVIGEAVVDGKGEIKNLAVLPEYQGKLYGMYIISSLVDYYKIIFPFVGGEQVKVVWGITSVTVSCGTTW